MRIALDAADEGFVLLKMLGTLILLSFWRRGMRGCVLVDISGFLRGE